MTDEAHGAPAPELQMWFDAWKTCTQNVLSQISGQSNLFELGADTIEAADSDLRYTVTVTGAVQGEIALRLPLISGIGMGRKFLGEAEKPAEPSATPEAPTISNDEREALDELLRQIAGLIATAVAASVGGEVQLQLSRAEAPWAGAADAVATLRTRDEAGAEIAFEICISPALAAAVTARVRAAASSQNSAATATMASTEAVRATLPPSAAGYRRLLEVGLGVKLRFGTRRMLLRDVLALGSGLVVELENPLNSPVDLLLDGRIVARGDVVVIDGKYGLRVTDVVDSDPGSGGAGHPN